MPLLFEFDGADDGLLAVLQAVADCQPVGRIELALKRHIGILERAINQCRQQNNFVAAAILWAAIEDTAETYRCCQRARRLRAEVDDACSTG